jgi:hypothetical protein
MRLILVFPWAPGIFGCIYIYLYLSFIFLQIVKVDFWTDSPLKLLGRDNLDEELRSTFVVYRSMDFSRAQGPEKGKENKKNPTRNG